MLVAFIIFCAIGVGFCISMAIITVSKKKKQNTYTKKGIEKTKIFEVSFVTPSDLLGPGDDKRTSIYLYEDCVIIKRESSLYTSCERIKIFDLSKISYQFYTQNLKQGLAALSIDINSKNIIDQTFDDLNKATWKSSNYYSSKIFLKFHSSDFEQMQNKVKNIKEAIDNALANKENSTDYLEEKHNAEEIENSVFSKDFIREYGCTLDQFKKNLVLISGFDQMLNSGLPIRKMALVYDGRLKKIAVCKMGLYSDNLVKSITFLSAEEKLLFISRPELEECGSYIDSIKTASVQKFKKLFYSVNAIESIKFIKAISSYTYHKPVNGFDLALKAEFIHPMYAVGSALESAEGFTTGTDISAFEMVFCFGPYEKMYFDKFYINDRSNNYNFLKGYLKSNK